MNLLGSIAWIIIVLGFFYSVYRILKRIDYFPDRELYVALTAGLIGSLAFSLLAPTIMPLGYWGISQIAVDEPTPEFTGYWKDSPPSYLVDHDSDRVDFYVLTIMNPNSRPISELSVTLDFPNCVEDTGSNSWVGIQPSNTDLSWAPPNIVHFSQPFGEQDHYVQCDAGLYIETLPPNRMVNAFFVTNNSANAPVRAEFTSRNLSDGEVYIDTSYMWEYRTIKYFPDPPGYTKSLSNGG